MAGPENESILVLVRRLTTYVACPKYGYAHRFPLYGGDYDYIHFV